MPESTPVVRCDHCAAYVRIRTDSSGILHAKHDCPYSERGLPLTWDPKRVVDVGVNKTGATEEEAAADLQRLFGK